MKNLTLLCALLAISLSLYAQQLPIFTQYRHYGGLINPADVPLDYFVNGQPPERFFKISGGQRLQWIGNENFNVSTSVIDGTGFFNLGNVSLSGGGYFIHDEVDVTKSDGFYGRAAVYVGDPRGTFWGGLGFNTGYVLHTIDLRQLKAYEANDPLLNYANLTASSFDLGVGGFGVFQWNQYDQVLLLGVSVPQILEPEITFTDNADFDYQRVQHIYGRATFIAKTRGDYGFFEVSVWNRYVPGVPMSVDLNLRYQVSSPFWFGLGASTNGTAHVEAGTNIPVGKISNYDGSQNYMQIGYGFDFPFNPAYSTYFGSSHEINLAFVIF